MGLFRSKSCTLPESDSPKASPAPNQYDSEEEEDAMEEEEEEDEEAHSEYVRLRRRKSKSCADIDELNLGVGGQKGRSRWRKSVVMINNPPILSIVLTALRRSLLFTCSVDTGGGDVGGDGDDEDMDIGWPIESCHVHHVTFDPFDGFSGLPMELQNELPSKVPSASMNVFGISANSMKWADDGRGNSVPTILLMLQERLYSEGGLQEEGIFRINAENGQDEYVRGHLSRAALPSHHIDVHCLAGLIKAWFRELPDGVLDSLTPDQVMHCNTEEECTQLVKLLPSTEAQLLDWAINLMADVVAESHCNKMNSRNIAMVFAPNMTQMADPLTALIHAVQVMNLLKTLIEKTMRERETPDSSVSSADDDMMKGVDAERFDGTLECVELDIMSYGAKDEEEEEAEVDEVLRKVSECFADWMSAPGKKCVLSRSQSLESGRSYRSDRKDDGGVQRRSAEGGTSWHPVVETS